MKAILFNIHNFVYFCSNQQKHINPKIQIIDKSIESIIDVYSEIEIIADSYITPRVLYGMMILSLYFLLTY